MKFEIEQDTLIFAIVAICILVFALSITCGITYSSVMSKELTKTAMENGYTQQLNKDSYPIWVKLSDKVEQE